MVHFRPPLVACLIAVSWLSGTVSAAAKAAEIQGTLQSAESDSFMLRGVITLKLPTDPSRPIIASKTAFVDSAGTFDIKGVKPGRYFFTPEGPQAALTYFKTINCDGLDYSARPLEVKPGDAAINCKITFARDSGKITGRVLDNREHPVKGFEVVAIPQKKELRSVFGHCAVSIPPTSGDGQFEIRGIIPGSYLVFSVPAGSREWYWCSSSNLVDRYGATAQHITIKSHGSTSLVLRSRLSK